MSHYINELNREKRGRDLLLYVATKVSNTMQRSVVVT